MEPPWLRRARNEMGVSEVMGEKHNARILEYHAETKLKATSDETPWCSAFACAMMEWSGVPSPKSAAARSWLTWGEAIDKPTLGCVVVLKRGTSETSGHVGFYVGEAPGFVQLLGGNQANTVSMASFPISMLLGYRLPGPEYWQPQPFDESRNDVS